MKNTITIESEEEFKEFINEYFTEKKNHIDELLNDGEYETAETEQDDLDREHHAIIIDKNYSSEFESIQWWMQDHCTRETSNADAPSEEEFLDVDSDNYKIDDIFFPARSKF